MRLDASGQRKNTHQSSSERIEADNNIHEVHIVDHTEDEREELTTTLAAKKKGTNGKVAPKDKGKGKAPLSPSKTARNSTTMDLDLDLDEASVIDELAAAKRKVSSPSSKPEVVSLREFNRISKQLRDVCLLLQVTRFFC